VRRAPEPIVIGAAYPADLPAVRHLLVVAGLPLDGIDEHVATMVVARAGGEIVGTAAVELYADGALLRSVAVQPSVQGQGVGQRLTAAALTMAREHGLDTAFLLTTTADTYFHALGFQSIARADVPASVQASIEFRSACPASATAMVKQLA
jgi:N-acetylglutamate synthase-like GNAT family acetyltransferase